jgi:hypothetical protein
MLSITTSGSTTSFLFRVVTGIFPVAIPTPFPVSTQQAFRYVKFLCFSTFVSTESGWLSGPTISSKQNNTRAILLFAVLVLFVYVA